MQMKTGELEAEEDVRSTKKDDKDGEGIMDMGREGCRKEQKISDWRRSRWNKKEDDDGDENGYGDGNDESYEKK